jgi:phospholipase/carboxylesterase
MSVRDFIHYYQPAENDTAPTLLLLHGTGGNEQSLVDLGSTLAPKAGLLSPRGKVLENGAPRFFRRLAEGVFDVPDLIFRTNELADFVEAAANEYHFDVNSLIAVGYSNGANIAASLLLLRPAVLSKAVLLRAMLPLEVDQLPDLKGKQVMIAAGESDPMLSRVLVERLAEVLKASGADVTLLWQRTGHQLLQADIQAASDWLGEL